MATLTPTEVRTITIALRAQCETMQSNMNNAPTAELEAFWAERFADAIDAVDAFALIAEDHAEIR